MNVTRYLDRVWLVCSIVGITVVAAQATFAPSCAPAIHSAPPIVIPTIEQTSHTRSR